MNKINSKLVSLKAVASDTSNTQSERNGAMLMIGKLVVKHEITMTVAIPEPVQP